MVEELNVFLKFLDEIESEFYSQYICKFSGSIGQHSRHIIEFYECFLDGYSAKKVNYDQRKRNIFYENDIHLIKKTVHNLMLNLEKITIDNTSIQITNNFNQCESSVLREIMFLSEHTVHHMAIIIILAEKNGFVFENELKQFGFSVSTQKHIQEVSN